MKRLLSFFLVVLSLAVRESAAQVVPHCGDLPRGAGLLPGEQGMVDRFNNPWRSHPHLAAWQKKRSLFSRDCGGFRLDFEDVILKTGIGFDDPTPVNHPILGATTLGEVRQRTVCEVFGYIGSLIDVKGSPDIIIQRSMMEGKGLLGAASPFFKNTAGPYVSGTMYDHITTGLDPTPTAGDYDASIVFDFNYPDWNNDWNEPSGARIDLYGVTLHEITHTLGFLSLIGPNGVSEIGGAWSLFDRRLYDETGRPLLNLATGTYQASPAAPTSNGVVFRNERCDGTESPVYSPPNYQSGSSMSHFDKNRTGIPYVMNPYASLGDNRQFTQPEIQTLCDLGYTLRNGLCGNCAPQGRDDFGSTSSGLEVCIDVLSNDIDPDNSGTLAIDPAFVTLESGAGSVSIKNGLLCYTPSPDYVGVAFLHYAPTDGSRTGPIVTVTVNVTGQPVWPPVGRKDAFIWYFGNTAGVAFTTGVPVALTDGKLANLEGSAAICSPRDGRLLFYTNGVSVWNARHKEMPNGTGLMGNWTSSQSALIVPHPADTNLFYIFTTGALPSSDKTFRYSVVDMRLDNGYGNVTRKNVALFARGTEKVGATRHCNGRDYWIIAHEWGSNRFYTYLLDSAGINDTVISDVGSVCPTQDDVQGSIQISPNGRMVGVTTTGAHIMELLDFDVATGLLSNARELKRGANFYGLEFSPDNSKLYYTTLPVPGDPAVVAQYDLKAGSINAIKASEVVLHKVTGGWDGAQMQMGPDGKIYVSYYGRNMLGVIARPNLQGTAAAYNHNGFSLAGRNTSYGICNVIDCDLYGVTIGFVPSQAVVSVSDPTPLVGDTVSYHVDVCNRGVVDRVNFEVEFALPEGISYIDGMVAYPRHQFAQLRAGECDSFVVRGLVLPSVRYNAELVSCTHLFDTTIPGCRGSLDACGQISVPATNLFVEKTADTTMGNVGDVVVYRIVVANNGPAPATNVTVKDVLPTALQYSSHSVAAPASFNSTTGELRIPTLDVGASVVLEVTTVIVGGAPGEVITNCAELTDVDQTDLDQRDNYSCAPVRIDGCTPVQLGVSMEPHVVYETGRLFVAPVTLTRSPPDSMRLSHLVLTVKFDPKVATLDPGMNATEIIRATLLQDWTILAMSTARDSLTIEVEAPAGTWLRNAGVMLRVPLRLYMSATGEISSFLHPSAVAPDIHCLEFPTTDGIARLDSICGLNFRFIRIERNGKYALHNVRPHPVGDYLGLEFELGLDGETTVELVDLAGRHVATPLQQTLQPGRYELMWDTHSLPNGRYVLLLRSGDWRTARTVVIQR